MNKKNVEPKLRFPGFKNHWNKTNFGELLDYERPDKYFVNNTNYNNKGTPVLTANKAFILGYTDEEYGIYTQLPVIIFDDFTVDKKYVDFPFKVKSSAIKILKPKFNNNLKFIYELMSTIKFASSEHKRYYISTYQNISIFVPQKLEEQDKIAECLSTVDELIIEEEAKLEQLKVHKKGLLQKLFPGQGDSNPSLRFPNFLQRWITKKLEEICIYKNGGSYENDIVENGKYNLITLNSIDIEGNLKKEHRLVNSGEWFLQKNDIVMVLSDVATGNFLGLSAVIPNNHQYVLNQRMGLLRVSSNYSADYVRYYINQNQKYFKSYGQGANQKNLSKKDILSFSINIPISIDEQQKIADCISSIDELISAQIEKIEALKQQKKGLLQGLFPSLEEVLYD